MRSTAHSLGGTVFRYATIFGTGFSTTAFIEGLAAGVRDEPFSLRAILLATREKYPGLKRARRQVAALQNDSEENMRDRRQLGDDNKALLLSIAQDVDVDYVWPLDIDHSYASASRTGCMQLGTGESTTVSVGELTPSAIRGCWTLGRTGRRRTRNRRGSSAFSRAGWGHAGSPSGVADGEGSITESEKRRFIQVDTEIDDDKDGAMNVFANLVAAPAELLDAPFEMLPARSCSLSTPNSNPRKTGSLMLGRCRVSSRND